MTETDARAKPLDHPTADRPLRVYVALTNSCNRSCPWCSTCSSPSGSTYLSVESFQKSLPPEGPFQIQLEGGEPTIHPRFWDFVRVAREHPRCDRLVLCTNGVVMPRRPERLRDWVAALGDPLTIKISVNHHLLDRDPGLLPLCRALRDTLEVLGRDRQLVVNVRLRRGYENDDQHVRDAIEAAGLLPVSNVFFLQRYGFAADESTWDPPRPVWDRFVLLNPDGSSHGSNLIARSEAMRVLP